MSNELHCRSKKLFWTSSDDEGINSDGGEELEDITQNFPRSAADMDAKPDLRKHSSESDQQKQSKENERSEVDSRLTLLAERDSNTSDSSKTKARSLPEEARTVLYAWNDKHRRNPTKDEKQELLRQTRIEPKQLKNWFCNTRRREKKNQVAVSAGEKKNIPLSDKPFNAKQQMLGREHERNSNELERKSSDSMEELNERQSKYAGVYYSIIAQKYKAQTTIPQNRCLGYFNLATDAARAVDIANIDMNTPDRVFNFESDDEYTMSRVKELEEIGVNVKTSSNDKKMAGKRLEGCLVYRGVAYQRTTLKFKSFLFHNLTQKYLGTYALAADAAWRFDLEVAKLNARGWPRNFENRQAYVAARANELDCCSNDIDLSDAEKDREMIVSWEKENQTFEDLQAKSNAKDSGSARSTQQPFPNSTTGLAKDLDSNKEHEKSNMHKISNAKEATMVERRADSKPRNATGNDSIDGKKKVSEFHGVHFTKKRSKYSAKIGKRYLGTFHLESDAARAYDISVRQLKIPGCNFGSDGDYIRCREKELNSHRSKVDNADTGEEREGLGHLTYRGVSYNKTSGKYKSIIFHNLKQNSLGSFTLAADAAMAFDMEVKRLGAPGWPLNFENRQAYKLARARELEKHGEEAERDSDKIKSQWSDYLKVRSKDPAFPPYIDQDEQCDVGMICTNDPNYRLKEVKKKGTKDYSQVLEAQGMRIPSKPSQSNQRDHNIVNPSIASEDGRQTGDEAKMEPASKVVGRQTCRTRECEAEPEIGNAKRVKLNEKTSSNTQNDNSKHVDHQNDDDFETNTHSNAESRITVPESVDGEKFNIGVTVAPGETSQGVMENVNVSTTKGTYCDSVGSFDNSEIATFQDQYSTKKSQNLLMQLTTDQIQVLNCPFPVGTLVWVITHCTNAYPVSFVVGQVVAIWMDLTEKVTPYEIQLNQSTSSISSIFIPENRIVFAPQCPVSILAAKSWCPGRIICCNIKRNPQDPAAILQPSYIVQLHRNLGVFQRVQGIEPGRIKYRKIDEELSPSFHTSNHGNQCRSQFVTSGKQELADDERGGDEIKSSQMSPQNFEKFSPKSPLSTPDHRPQKLPNVAVKSTTRKDDVERALPRLGMMDRVDNQSPEAKTHKYSSIDAAMAPPKWNLPSSRCAQTPSSNDKSSLTHTPRPPKWQPPVSHDVSTPKRSSTGEVTGEERKRARSPSSSRGTSAKDLSQKFAQERESSERIPHCRVHFPKWLFYDNMAKDHIIYQFTKKNNPPETTNLLTVIGQKTNCFLRTENHDSSRIFDLTRIFIESNNMTNDPINVREAKEQIEDFLLKYIQHDGCQGRLFYDIARGDTFFHPRSNVRHFAGSIAIMQRNPFSGRKEIGWMSVVELPFEVDRNSRRLYHGHSLIGLQSRLRNEFSCFIKLCGNEFKRYPIKYGNPYAWVWGKRAQDVDSAIEVILAELKQHRRECRRCQFEGR